MMRPPLPARALDYLRSHNVMTLATTGPLGVWAAAVFYVNEKFRLYFLSSRESRHVLNIDSHPSVSASIQEDCADWTAIKGIQLEGEARRIDGVERGKAISLYGTKFPVIADLARAPGEIVRAFAHVEWFELIPSRLYYIDNSLGLGHRDEVPLTKADL